MIGKIGTNDSLSKNKTVNFYWKSTENGIFWKNIALTSLFHKNNVNIYYLFGRFGAKITFNDLF